MNRRAFALGLGLTALLWAPFLVKAQAPSGTARSPHGNLAGDCSTCHTAEGWTPLRKPLQFDHQGTGFPLVAAHAQVGCRDCHKSLVFSQVPTACSDCHRDAHRGEMGPDCESCHTPESWTNRREAFRLHSRTRFPLLGPHAGLDCEACHRGAQPREFTGLNPDCSACHLPDFQNARNPDHQRLGFSQQCDMCHSPASRSWQGGTFGAGFPHPAVFPLTGAHTSVACSSCHINGRFAGTPHACVACHQADYDRTTSPNHRSAGFPTTCENCHSTTQWPGAAVDHNLTRFPLTGAHIGVECTRCHVNNRFAGTPTDCFSCHQDDFNRAQPDHRNAGFGTSCQNCHSTTRWEGAAIDHNRTNFPLTGAHTRVSCDRCHVNGRFAGTPTACFSCHQADYNRAQPNHQSSGFPTTCQNCHSTNTWSGATFNHPFPITSGAHRGFACADCHPNSGNFGVFTCTTACHPRARMDDRHRGRAGYQYESSACLRCHPQGRGD